MRDERGAEHDALGGTLVVRGGILSRDVPMPVNALPGTWRISVQDPLIGLAVDGESVVVE